MEHGTAVLGAVEGLGYLRAAGLGAMGWVMEG